MRLTKTLRDAFIRSAMNDVPKIDYKQQIIDLVTADFVNQLPPDVLKAYKKHPEYINKNYYYISECRFSTSIVRPDNGSAALTSETREKICALNELLQAQTAQHDGLRDKLTGAAYGCTTRKALATMLPEFEKYLPAENEPTSKNLPALANLVADFTKAGWPKGKK